MADNASTTSPASANGMPALDADKTEWLTWALKSNPTTDVVAAATMTKAQIVKKFGGEAAEAAKAAARRNNRPDGKSPAQSFFGLCADVINENIRVGNVDAVSEVTKYMLGAYNGQSVNLASNIRAYTPMVDVLRPPATVPVPAPPQK